MLGFGGPREGRSSCGANKHLAMPKTFTEQKAFVEDVRQAMQSGASAVSDTEHHNVHNIWLGGHWSGTKQAWEWDDGSPMARVNWAKDQPAPTLADAWVCMAPDGHVRHARDSDSFAIICEAEAGAAGTGHARILDDTAEVLSGSPLGPLLSNQLTKGEHEQRKFSIHDRYARLGVRHWLDGPTLSQLIATLLVVSCAGWLVIRVAKRTRAVRQVAQLLNGTDETMDILIGTAN